jgi:hypothetical protein
MTNDPIVNAVRQERDKLSKAFNYNVQAIFADLRSREEAHGDRLVKQTDEQVNAAHKASSESAS